VAVLAAQGLVSVVAAAASAIPARATTRIAPSIALEAE